MESKIPMGWTCNAKTALAVKLVYKIACVFLHEEKDGPKAKKSRSIYPSHLFVLPLKRLRSSRREETLTA